MKTILQYIQKYFYEVDKAILTLVSLLTAILIFLNYYYGIDKNISSYSFLYSFISWYIIFLVAFALPYVFYRLLKKRKYTSDILFLFLLLLVPAIFSLKTALDVPLHFSDDANRNEYWNNVFYWPLRLIIISGILFIIWKIFDSHQPFYGLVTKNIKWKPYWLMFPIMFTLISCVFMQSDLFAM